MSAGDPMPMDVSKIAPSTFVGEVVMKQEMTAFLQAAKDRGCRYQVGTDMLFEQIPAYLEFFGFKDDDCRRVARDRHAGILSEQFESRAARDHSRRGRNGVLRHAGYPVQVHRLRGASRDGDGARFLFQTVVTGGVLLPRRGRALFRTRHPVLQCVRGC
jgi:hypothetical protein